MNRCEGLVDFYLFDVSLAKCVDEGEYLLSAVDHFILVPGLQILHHCLFHALQQLYLLFVGLVLT